ncbi:hypothetical protein CHH83_05925 [Bacillus sp. 7586-K]|nr:hypothetical protein CHH83_05925 [Bacillus sp. 7586-K]
MPETNVQAENREYVVEFKKPYKFENETYTEIELSGLENLSAEDLISADKIFASSGQFAMMNEMNLGYCLILASLATNKPTQFFEKLPAKDALKVKHTVMGFLNE